MPICNKLFFSKTFTIRFIADFHLTRARSLSFHPCHSILFNFKSGISDSGHVWWFACRLAYFMDKIVYLPTNITLFAASDVKSTCTTFLFKDRIVKKNS